MMRYASRAANEPYKSIQLTKIQFEGQYKFLRDNGGWDILKFHNFDIFLRLWKLWNYFPWFNRTKNLQVRSVFPFLVYLVTS